MGEQNWLAVGLDFLIVVMGVFIGVQLGNWNGARADRAAYEDALDRSRAEIAVNLETLVDADEGNIVRLQQVGVAIDALQACRDSDEARSLINHALNRIMGTSGLSLRDSALQELTSSPRLLAQQDEVARRRFSDTAYLKSVFLREANFIEMIPLEERTQDNPIIEIGPREMREVDYAGVDYSRAERKLRLSVPVSVACQDNQLIKDFYTWERWQSALPAVTRILRTQLEEDLDWLDARS